MRFRFLVLLLAPLGAIPVPGPGPAAAASGVDSVRFNPADSVWIMPPERISGERVRLPTTPPARAYPRVELTAEQVTRFQPDRLADALVSLPGVEIARTGSWTSRAVVRGLSGDRVLMLVDGVRVNPVRGHGPEPSMIGVDAVENLELHPGSGGARFGSGAMGGVLQIDTHAALLGSPRLHLKPTARVGSEGGGWNGLIESRLLHPTWGLELKGGMGGLDALELPDGPLENSGYREESWSARGALLWGPLLLDLEHGYGAARDVGIPVFNSDTGGRATLPLQSRRFDRLEAVLAPPGSPFSLRFLGDLQEFKTHTDETFVDSVFVRRRFTGYRVNDTEHRVAGTSRGAQGLMLLETWGDPVLRAEIRREGSGGPFATEVEILDQNGVPRGAESSTGDAVPASKRDMLSLAAGISPAVDRWRFDAALRYDAVRSRADSSASRETPGVDTRDRRFSADLGAAVRTGPVSPYLRLGTGFRVPKLDERFYNGYAHGAIYIFGNAGLEPETSLTLEGGVWSEPFWGGRIRSVRAAVYRTEVEDMITFRYVGQLYLVPRFQYQNVARARLEGFETAVDAHLAPLDLQLSFTLPRGEDRDTGEPILEVGPPRAALTVGVPLTRWIPGGALSARVRWSGEKEDPQGNLGSPGFATLSLEAETVVGGVRARLAVRNLTDASHREPLSFIPEPGRTVTLALSRDFSVPLDGDTRRGP